MPLTVKQILHTVKGSQHLYIAGAAVEVVQRSRVTIKTQPYQVPALGVANLPKVPGCLCLVLGYLESGYDRVVSRQTIWVNVAG